MSNELWAAILNAIILIGGIFGVGVYIKKLITALRESAQVGAALDKAAETIEAAYEDKVFDKEEIEAIKVAFDRVKKELQEAKTAWHELFKRIGKRK